jgi:uncharacterized membrane protein YGL010W
MPRNRKRIFFEFPFILIIAVLLLGFVVMLLWNFIFPIVLHTEKITYWQALGLFVLCRILFFGFNRRRFSDRKPHMWRNNAAWRQKWMSMNDEERAKFREEWKKRCRRPGE